MALTKFEPVKIKRSTNVKIAQYDVKNKVLRIDFQTGGQYDYLNVDTIDVQALQNAPSAGHFLSETIKVKYKFKKIK